jgi:hypothetical protein
MAGKSIQAQQDILDWFFFGVLNDSLSTYTDWYISLHTGDPDVAANPTSLQSYLEVSYNPYARQPVPRTSAGWVRTANVISLVNAVQFPEVVSGTAIATHWAIGRDVSGGGLIYYSGPLSRSISISALGVPTISQVNTSITEE